jgi:hypothetical protein
VNPADATGAIERINELMDEFTALQGVYVAPDFICDSLDTVMRRYLGPFWGGVADREAPAANNLSLDYPRGYVQVGYNCCTNAPLFRHRHDEWSAGTWHKRLNGRLRNEMLEHLSHWLADRFGAPVKRVSRKDYEMTRELAHDFRATFHGDNMCKEADSEYDNWDGLDKPLTESTREAQTLVARFPEGTRIVCLRPKVTVDVTEVTAADPLAPAALKGAVLYTPPHRVPGITLETNLFVRMPERPDAMVYVQRKTRDKYSFNNYPMKSTGSEYDVPKKARPAPPAPAKPALDWYLDK